MRTEDDIRQLIFDKFRNTKAVAGNRILMQVFRFSILSTLAPKEKDLFNIVLNDLVVNGFFIYQERNPESLKLTEKGFDHIYNSEKVGQLKEIDKTVMLTPLQTIKAAISKVPFVKYALGVAGIAAAGAIVKSFALEKNNSIPVISLLIMFGFTILLFIFSSMANSKEKHLKIAGYLLVYTTVLITCTSSILLTTSVFFDKPKPIAAYKIFQKDSSERQISDTAIAISSKGKMQGRDSTQLTNTSLPGPSYQTGKRSEREKKLAAGKAINFEEWAKAQKFIEKTDLPLYSNSGFMSTNKSKLLLYLETLSKYRLGNLNKDIFALKKIIEQTKENSRDPFYNFDITPKIEDEKDKIEFRIRKEGM